VLAVSVAALVAAAVVSAAAAAAGLASSPPGEFAEPMHLLQAAVVHAAADPDAADSAADTPVAAAYAESKLLGLEGLFPPTEPPRRRHRR
jgi:hypothetical protein